MHLAQELLINVWCSGGLRSSAKDMKALKMNEVASHWKSTMTSWEQHQADLKATNKLLKDSSTILWSFSIWSKLKKWKSLISGCLISWLKIKKIVILTCCLLLFCATTVDHFSIGLWHVVKSGLYMTTGNDQVSGWTEKKLQSASQSQPYNKKMSWLLFGGLLLVWSITAFWIWGKPLHLRNVLSKLMRCIENCHACSQHWSTEMAQFFSMTTHCTMNASKVERIGPRSFASSTIFTWPLTNQLPLLQTSWQLFAGKMLPQPAGCRICFPRVYWSLKHRFLHCRNTQTYFSSAKSVLIVMVPILINEDVSEPSYTDLKFKIQNCNYFCINLIHYTSYYVLQNIVYLFLIEYIGI